MPGEEGVNGLENVAASWLSRSLLNISWVDTRRVSYFRLISCTAPM